MRGAAEVWRCRGQVMFKGYPKLRLHSQHEDKLVASAGWTQLLVSVVVKDRMSQHVHEKEDVYVGNRRVFSCLLGSLSHGLYLVL